MESMLHPPKRPLELFKMLPEGPRCQLIDNHIVMSPSPVWRHQDIVRLILTTISNHLIKKPVGKVLADVDVYINDENVYRPDIFFVSNNQMEILGEDGYIHGAPELVIEVLSPGTSKYDKTKKKATYALYGVKEYWFVEPSTMQCSGFINENGSFRMFASGDTSFHIELLDLTVDLNS